MEVSYTVVVQASFHKAIGVFWSQNQPSQEFMVSWKYSRICITVAFNNWWRAVHGKYGFNSGMMLEYRTQQQGSWSIMFPVIGDLCLDSWAPPCEGRFLTPHPSVLWRTPADLQLVSLPLIFIPPNPFSTPQSEKPF